MTPRDRSFRPRVQPLEGRVVPANYTFLLLDAGGSNGPGQPAIRADIDNPSGVAANAAGVVYFSDTTQNEVDSISPPASSGTFNIIAGDRNSSPGFSGDGGPAAAAQLNAPTGVAVDAAGNVFIADGGNHRVRKVDAATGVITTVAGTGTARFAGDAFSPLGVGDGGPATDATLTTPTGLAVNAAGDLFIADPGDDRVRKVSAATGVITTVAGTSFASFGGDGGAATSATLNDPTGVAANAAGDLFIADANNNAIRKVNAATGVITTVAGTGTAGFAGDGGAATAARLNAPTGVAVDAAGDLLVADGGNSRVRAVNTSTGVITTVAGNGTTGFGLHNYNGPATRQQLDQPSGLGVGPAGDVFLTDYEAGYVEQLSPITVTISPPTLPDAVVGTAYSQTLTAAGGTGPYTFAVTAGSLPAGLALSPAGVLSGTPTAAATSSFTATATDGAGDIGSLSYTLTVAAAPVTLTVGPPTLPDATVGTAYSQALSAASGTGPYTFAVTAGLLPAGLTLSSAGLLSGIPTATTAGAAFAFTVAAGDAAGDAGDRSYTVAVDAAPVTLTITPAALPNGTAGAAYSQTLSAAGGTGPYTFAVTGGSLPPGLTLSPTGVVSGTPAAAAQGDSSFTVTATDLAGDAGSQSYTLTVAASPPANPPVVPPVVSSPVVPPTSPPASPPPVVPPVVSPPASAPPVSRGAVPEFAVSGGATSAAFGPAGGLTGQQFTPFGAATGTRTAVADVTGDGIPDQLVGSGVGAAVRVVGIDGATGQVVRTFAPFEASFTGGASVAAADVTGDGYADIAVGADVGGGARVAVYDGRTGAVLADFLGIADPAFRGGARVAFGDVSGDGAADLVVAAGAGGGPRVAVFDGATLRPGRTPGRLTADFFAFEPTLRVGAFAAAGDVTGDGRADLVFGGGPGGGPRVLVVDGRSLLATGVPTAVADFFAADPSLRGGATVAATDLDGDGKADLVVAVPTAAGGRVESYSGAALAAGQAPPVLHDYGLFDDSLGVYVG